MPSQAAGTLVANAVAILDHGRYAATSQTDNGLDNTRASLLSQPSRRVLPRNPLGILQESRRNSLGIPSHSLVIPW